MNSRLNAAQTTAALVQATVPSGLPDQHRLTYALAALLKPFGLKAAFEGGCPDPGGFRLSWPGAKDKWVGVEVARLREAFRAVSGEREFGAPRDAVGRVGLAGLGADCSQPWLSQWGRELASQLAAMQADWRLPRERLTVSLTHDVERVHPLEPLGLMGRCTRVARGLLRGSLSPAGDLVRWLRSAGQFFGVYDNVMRMERDLGATATYFFMSGPYSLRRYGSRSGRSLRLRRLLQMARGYGHRVGLHGCVYSLRRDNYARQRESLSQDAGQEVTWHRNHYLVYDAARSPGRLAAAGFRVDCTYGLHDGNAFRAGLAHPYQPWDWGANRPSPLVEVPMVFMDGAGNLPVEEEWADVYRQLKKSEEVGGMVAVLFHVECFVGNPDGLRRYAELLDWLKGRGACLDADVADGAA